MAAAAAGAGGSACPRTKPEIYKTDNGKVIVEDELLNFIVVKMKTLSHDDIIMLTTNNFPSEWIEESKRVLFVVCPNTTVRCTTHKGPQKDINNIKACLKVLNECGENIPRFVSHYLDELPPVGFGDMDASALLGRLERLSREVSGLKRSMLTQAEVGENLGAIVAAMDRRVSAAEMHRIRGSDAAHAVAVPGDVRERPGHASQEGTASLGERRGSGSAGSALKAKNGLGGSTQLLLEVAALSAGPQPQSPQWSTVVKNGRKKERATDVAPKPHRKREQRNAGVVGTGKESNIGVVKTKLVKVFATKFSPTLDADTLCGYLAEKLENNTVTCRKIESANNRYSSFHITAECNNVADMYDPNLWPAGIYVRRYYEPRGKGSVAEGGWSGLRAPPLAQLDGQAV